MIAAGWEVDSHTLTHPDLTTVGDAQLRARSRTRARCCARASTCPVDFFCYPAGRNDARVRAAVRAAGYKAATTVDPGIAAAPTTRSRCRGSASTAPTGRRPCSERPQRPRAPSYAGRLRSSAPAACSSASTACAALRPFRAITLPAGCVAAPHR